MEERNCEVVKFVDGDLELEVNVSPKEETLWLTQEQMSLLFNVNVPAIAKHIKIYIMLTN